MKMKIIFDQVQVFEFDFKDDVMHNIMKMNISIDQVQVFESLFNFDAKIETKLCIDTIHLYPHDETKVCICLIQSFPKFFT